MPKWLVEITTETFHCEVEAETEEEAKARAWKLYSQKPSRFETKAEKCL